jgi:hypothetical protein
MPKSTCVTTKFLNLDLDIRSGSELDELLEGLKPDVVVMNHESAGYASVELRHLQPKTIDEAILHYSKIILSLPSHLRALWENCDKRTMNVGIEAGNEPYSTSFAVSESTTALLVAMRAELVFTVYQYDEANSG